VHDGPLAGVAESVAARDRSGRTPLHWAAAAGKHGFAEVPISAGARVDAVDARGLTPLDHALLHGQHAVAELLISSDEGPRPGAS